MSLITIVPMLAACGTNTGDVNAPAERIGPVSATSAGAAASQIAEGLPGRDLLGQWQIAYTHSASKSVRELAFSTFGGTKETGSLLRAGMLGGSNVTFRATSRTRRAPRAETGLLLIEFRSSRDAVTFLKGLSGNPLPTVPHGILVGTTTATGVGHCSTMTCYVTQYEYTAGKLVVRGYVSCGYVTQCDPLASVIARTVYKAMTDKSRNREKSGVLRSSGKRPLSLGP